MRSGAAPIEQERHASPPVMLAVGSLVANDYNPNEMTKEQLAELVAEVRHLGGLPKPVIVRPAGEGYVIVDGEHGWRAAMTVGLADVPCEIVDVDDFEARRQTFKRNQHGTHHPVRLGQMFQQMMAARTLSQRALAREIEVSEGTIRNALFYAHAASLRNCYAEADGYLAVQAAQVDIGALSIRQVRTFVDLPDGLRFRWLAGGADPSSVGVWQWIDASLYNEYWPKQMEFPAAIKQVKKWSTWERHWCIHGLTHQALRPYTRHFFTKQWAVRGADLMDIALEHILDTSTGSPRFLLTPEEFEAVLLNGGVHGDSHSLFCQRLAAAVTLKGYALPAGRNWKLRQQLHEHEIANGAPDYIRASALPITEKYAVWKTPTPDGIDDALAERTRRQLARSEHLYAENAEDAERIVRRTFAAAAARGRIKHLYRKVSERELAERIAKWFPLYDAGDPVEALMISALTDKLMQFSRVELICLEQMAEGWEWDATLATLLKACSVGGK